MAGEVPEFVQNVNELIYTQMLNLFKYIYILHYL